MRVVICCGAAGPTEIADDALVIGRALMARGHSVAFVAGDPAELVDHAGGWMPAELHQAPMRRPGPQLVLKQPSPDGLADQLAMQGFDDKQVLLTLARMWSQLFTLLRPDVILGFHMPLAWLVGPGHAPTFALGNGATLPPVVDTGFPRLRAQSVPLGDEEFLLRNANAALSMLGHPSLAALSDLIGRCEVFLYGVPAFDPYLAYRRGISAGLLGARSEPVIPPVDPRLAVIIDAYCPGIETIVLALAGYDRTPTDIWLAGSSSGMRRFLAHQPHVQLWNEKAALLDQAAAASVLVHHGEHVVAECALALGRPQFVIPWTTEQNLLLLQLRPMGQTWDKAPTAPVEEMAGAFRAVLKDNSLVTAAQHHARQLSGMNLPVALPALLDRIDAIPAGEVRSRRDRVALT